MASAVASTSTYIFPQDSISPSLLVKLQSPSPSPPPSSPQDRKPTALVLDKSEARGTSGGRAKVRHSFLIPFSPSRPYSPRFLALTALHVPPPWLWKVLHPSHSSRRASAHPHGRGPSPFAPPLPLSPLNADSFPSHSAPSTVPPAPRPSRVTRTSRLTCALTPGRGRKSTLVSRTGATRSFGRISTSKSM